jgi:hypothetical protein
VVTRICVSIGTFGTSKASKWRICCVVDMRGDPHMRQYWYFGTSKASILRTVCVVDMRGEYASVLVLWY